MLFPEGDSAFGDALPEDLISYINQRWYEVKSIFDPAGIVQEKHHRGVFKFGQLELLTIPLGKLYELGELGLLQTTAEKYCAIAGSLTNFPSEHQNTTIGFANCVNCFSDSLKNCLLYRGNLWKGNDMRELESLLSEAKVLPEHASTSKETPARTTNSASTLDIARHIARDHPYAFPAPVRVNEGMPTQTAETPKKEVVPTPGLARADEKQQMLKNKRRETWQARRLKNFRTLWQLKTPTGPVIKPSATDLERGEKSGNVPTETAPALMSGARMPVQLHELAS